MYDSPVRIIDFYGYNETVLSPLALVFLIIAGLLLFTLPRRYAVLPLIASACFIYHRQRIVLGGIDFSILRIMVILGAIRILTRLEYRQIELNNIDKTVIVWALVSLITGTILEKSGTGLINRLGVCYDILGMYFLCRIFIQNLNDIEIVIRYMIIMGIPIAIFMSIEKVTGRNFFSIFGINEYTMIRDGRLRAQGAFSHPILAGTFGALLLTQTIGYWQKTKKVLLTCIGLFSATLITICSASSGPIIGYASGIAGLFLWNFRKYTKKLFWGSIAGLFCLHIFMNAPVWHLISRISLVGGSTGGHRVRLINAAINHFGEWWLVGTKNTAYWGWGLQDTTNMYLAQGVDGGLLRMLLFIAILALCFKAVGKAVKNLENKRSSQKFIWALGATLLVHAVSFMGVSYFGQFTLFLYLSFAIASSISSINFSDKTQRPPTQQA